MERMEWEQKAALEGYFLDLWREERQHLARTGTNRFQKSYCL